MKLDQEDVSGPQLRLCEIDRRRRRDAGDARRDDACDVGRDPDHPEVVLPREDLTEDGGPVHLPVATAHGAPDGVDAIRRQVLVRRVPRSFDVGEPDGVAASARLCPGKRRVDPSRRRAQIALTLVVGRRPHRAAARRPRRPGHEGQLRTRRLERGHHVLTCAQVDERTIDRAAGAPHPHAAPPAQVGHRLSAAPGGR